MWFELGKGNIGQQSIIQKYLNIIGFGLSSSLGPGGGGTPTATTNAATIINLSKVRLNGTVNAGGTASTFTFEYGPTIAYGTNINATPSGSSLATDITVYADLEELNSEIEYHYRVINSNGPTNGSDMTFIISNTIPIKKLVMTKSCSVQPTVNDDSSLGYSIGSKLVNIIDGTEYVCKDATVGAAVWHTINSTAIVYAP
jgi:hypothetical protein